ncbi:MAG: LLM class F420-dependent oxidoreductase [Nitriliruptorales bacterium]|nr:LLM class F420-dependent oxidoreductase [Nitriliruptorales bacterium]
MRLGVTAMLTDRSIGPVELAVEAEAHGFDGLYLPEHTHIPVSRESPHPLGYELPEDYKRTLDPFVSLAAAASATERIRLGTGIALVAARDPILLAKEVATLDLLSGGRAVLGVGFGWNKEELADHGVVFSERRARTWETVEAVRALWSEEEAAYAGEHVSFGPTWQWPKPVQDRVPVWVGVTPGPKNLADVAAHADAWIPHGSRGLEAALDDLGHACDAAGRDVGEIEIVPFGSLPTPDKLGWWSSLGCAEVVIVLVDVDRDAALRGLEAAAGVFEEWKG